MHQTKGLQATIGIMNYGFNQERKVKSAKFNFTYENRPKIKNNNKTMRQCMRFVWLLQLYWPLIYHVLGYFWSFES